MAKFNLTKGNFKWIAKQLHADMEPEVVMAFSKVECKRDPFDKDGFPAILYERHVFYRNVIKHHGTAKAKEWSKSFPNLCYSRGYGKGGYGSYSGQRKKFSAAFALCPDCAMEGCSWGAFQELGENWEDYGFASVGEFVDTMKDGLYGQSIVFIKSIRSRGLVTPMLNHRFATMAEKYNGKGYREFNYDGQIKDAYEDSIREKINWSKVKSEEPERSQTQIWIGDIAKTEKIDDFVDPEIEPEVEEGESIDPSPVEPKVAIEKPAPQGYWQSVKTDLTALAGGDLTVAGVAAKAEQTNFLGMPSWFWYLLIAVVVVASGVYLFTKWKKHKLNEERDLELTNQLVQANSTPENKVIFFHKEEADKLQAEGYKLVWR